MSLVVVHDAWFIFSLFYLWQVLPFLDHKCRYSTVLFLVVILMSSYIMYSMYAELLMWFMIKIELHSCIIYVIGVHMVSVTLLYLIEQKQCQFTCSQSFDVRALISVQSFTVIICNWCFRINHVTIYFMTRVHLLWS